MAADAAFDAAVAAQKAAVEFEKKNKMPVCPYMMRNPTDSSDFKEYSEMFERDGIKLNEKYPVNNDVIDNIMKSFKNFVGADCWAVVVNSNKIIFNSYVDEDQHPATRIDEMNRRDALIRNPHSSLFVYFYRQAVNQHVDVYMFDCEEDDDIPVSDDTKKEFQRTESYRVRYEFTVDDKGNKFWCVRMFTYYE